jgi:tetratricopeptide (TPR) repeat protein
MKIFLSSTYLDLIEHRKAVVQALRTSGEEVEHMEVFGARDEEPTKASLEELDKCDVLVGIYAYRYGTVPKGTKTSVTEQEYLYAEKKNLTILVFVVNENHPWQPKLIDKSLTKVNRFKSKATDNHTPAYFTTPDNLASQVVAAIGKLAKITKKSRRSPKARKSIEKVAIKGVKEGVRGSTLPNQSYFFGREKELKQIEEALSPESRTWGALIDGPGGIGKTALAIRSAHLAPPSLFDRKIFITAKVRELTPEGEKPLKDFTRDNYFSMLNELALELGENGIPKLAPDERANPLRMAMAGKKTLVVFDNLETLSENERTRLYQFLSRLPEGNKAIATSRRGRRDIDARAIRLDRMERLEAIELIEKLAETNPRLARENKEEHQKLYGITNGNPLLIKWVCGQLGREGSAMYTIEEACRFIENAPKGNDPLEYIFGDLLETFTESETKMLAALTHFTQPAKVEWLAQMTELPERAAETALDDLADRSILIANSESHSFHLPSLAAQFIRARRPEAVSQTGDTLINQTIALSLQYGGHHNYEGFRTLDVKWDFISAALPRLLTGNNHRIQIVCEMLDQFLNFTGRWDEAIWLAEQTEVLALESRDKNTAGWRAHQAGWIYFSRDQPEEVLECARRASKHWSKSSSREKGAAIRLRGLGYKIQGDYDAAMQDYREALEIWRAISPESDDVANVLNDIAIIERIKRDYDSAERTYYEILSIDKKINNQEGIPTIIGNLATLALERKQWAEAESLAREALELHEKFGRHDMIAHDCNRLAQALLNQDKNLEEAKAFARRAVDIFTRLRVPDSLQSAQKTLLRVEKKVK